MKTLALTVTLLFTSLFNLVTEPTIEDGQTITITIDNVKNNNGHVIIALHTAETFMRAKGIQSKSVAIENGKVKAIFTNVASGTYAIMALHDENKNNRMDFDNGMPQEHYGMSNNPMSYGPPQFSDAKFEVTTEDLEFKIRF